MPPVVITFNPKNGADFVVDCADRIYTPKFKT